ncbi:MAG TPA: hypothetical protein VG413_01955 [Candidatus Dormibacteraeota bacterium]|jgi:hypothetical protein|nr:hypothetical protein [Candidatus Dormibacteraeota bacterium]
MARAETSRLARCAIAGVTALLLVPSVSVRPASAAAPPLPTFGNPTISGIQGFGFEQDLRLDTHGRVYTSVPGSLGSNLSYVWRSLNGGQTFKWIPAASQPVGKLPMCNGGGDTELATDSADRLYVNDLALANYGTARSSDQGRTLTASPTCTSVLTTPDDRPWYAVDGDPMAGGSITLAYNVAPNATPLSLGACTPSTAALSNKLVFARSPLPNAPETAGLVFGAPQVVTQGCDEGIMGNDEIHTYGTVKRVFAMHNNDALNQIRMARCDIVAVTPLTPTGYANCVDTLVLSDPTSVNGGDFPTLTIDRAGNLFAVWEQAPCGPCPNTTTGNTYIFYAFSTNQGDSWSAPRQLPTPGLNTNVFAWPAAGDPGRVDVAWYGTLAQAPNPGNGPCSVNGDWGLYLAQSLNFTAADPGWTQPILASEHLVHHGSVQTLMGGQTGDRTLGDFLQLRIGLQGEANISYADSNSATEALASQGMFVQQNGGASLLASRPVVHGQPRRINSVTVGSHAATYDSAGMSSPTQPNLEILGSQVARSADHSTYQVRMQVADLRNLAADPKAGGSTLVWNTQWKVPSATDPHGGAYFHAYMESVPGSSPTFWVGQNAIETTGSLTFTYPGSAQVTGSYTAGAPGVISINVPVADVVEPGAIDSLLYSVTASSMSIPVGNAETPPSVFGSGIGGNLFNLIDVAPAYDFNPAQPTPPFVSCHEADGDGQVGRATVHFDADACEDGDAAAVDVQDAGGGTDFHATGLTAVSFDDLTHAVTIVGEGTDAGRPVTFTMLGVDNGSLPGFFNLILSDGYVISGTLTSGSIQLR